MKNVMRISSVFLLTTALMLFGCKKDEEENSGSNSGTGTATEKGYLLVIENGAQTVGPDDELTYEAYFVNENGEKEVASNVSWESSNTDCATIASSGTITIANTGVATITAKVTLNGISYEATVPLSVRIPSLLAVVPSAVIMQVGDVENLTTILMGTSSLTSVKYESNSTNVEITSSGVLTAKNVGFAVITVTGNSNEGELVTNVPVTVIGVPKVPLPVTHIVVDPNDKLIFKNDKITLSATAYNSDNEVVSGTNFLWESENSSIASVETDGSVTGLSVGIVNIRATAKGIIGTAQIEVQPDTVVMITPFFFEIEKGQSKQFKAELVNNRTGTLLASDPNDFSWFMFETGISVLDPGTVNSTGLVSAKPTALEGTMGHVLATYNKGNSNELTGMSVFMVGIGGFGFDNE